MEGARTSQRQRFGVTLWRNGHFMLYNSASIFVQSKNEKIRLNSCSLFYLHYANDRLFICMQHLNLKVGCLISSICVKRIVERIVLTSGSAYGFTVLYGPTQVANGIFLSFERYSNRSLLGLLAKIKCQIKRRKLSSGWDRGLGSES